MQPPSSSAPRLPGTGHEPPADSTRDLAPLPLVRPSRRASMRGFSLRPSRQSGEVIGERYLVEGFLGEGGTATVYLARDLKTQGLVVVKQMKSQVASVSELRQRFVLEAEALSNVHHPAVVRVLDIEQPEGQPPFLTLEALRGETLGDYLKRTSIMPVDLAVLLLRQTARALEAVHQVGIVHRDVKPDNIFLLGPIDEPSGVKVLDFGMALLADEIPDEDSTSILGTAQYMAPEQILVETVDARTDIYALGVVMFRMLTGHLPFEGQSKKDLLRHQLFSPVPPATWLNEDLPPEIAGVIHRCTRKSPTLRFPSMTRLMDALDHLVGLGADGRSEELYDMPTPSQAVDVYEPRTDRGRRAADVLAQDFGIYARPHSLVPGPKAG